MEAKRRGEASKQNDLIRNSAKPGRKSVDEKSAMPVCRMDQ
jgi:hypothetical protein